MNQAVSLKPVEKKRGWFAKLSQGLSKSAQSLRQSLRQIFTGKAFDKASAEALEDALIRADIGPQSANKLVGLLQRQLLKQDFNTDTLPQFLSAEIAQMLSPFEKPLIVDTSQKPFVVLIIGVNGSGKTTTIAKLTRHFQDRGLKIMLGAADTFRAAAIEQISHWGAKLGARVIAGKAGQDPASVAWQAMEAAKIAAENQACDVLLIDTAGRLHNKTELMAELGKITRSLKKQVDSAPHATILVLDATVGQNALMQVEAFDKITPITGLVMTKLDGTARGGILLAITERFHLPIHFIGVGESADDLDDFSAVEFANALLGLEDDDENAKNFSS